MASYDLYGFFSADLTRIADRLGSILGVDFVLHESSFRGGDYYRSGMPGAEEELILQRNVELDGELAEPQFEEYPILLYVAVSNIKRSDEIKQLMLTGMKGEALLLRHEVL